MFEGMTKTVMNIGIVVLLIAAIAVALGAFQDSQTDNSYSYNITGDGLTLFDNLTGQFGTVGTMIGIGLLLAAVVGAFWLFGRNR